jgi:hypothetical protein
MGENKVSVSKELYYMKLPIIQHVLGIGCPSYMNLLASLEKLLQEPKTKSKQYVWHKFLGTSQTS